MWSRRFLGNLDISIPQLGLFSSVQSVKADKPGPLGEGSAGNAAWRQQVDGEYSVSYVSPMSPIVPDSFKLFSEFFGSLLYYFATIALYLSNHLIITA